MLCDAFWQVAVCRGVWRRVVPDPVMLHRAVLRCAVFNVLRFMASYCADAAEMYCVVAVSYTHLTLPTICSV
eukprot:15454822-Alexandrium_andersonii.AAC.1